MGQPFALDHGAIMLVGAARGVNLELLANVLPMAERAILSALSDEGGDDVQ